MYIGKRKFNMKDFNLEDLKGLLSACERLNSIYDRENSYDELQYEFSLTDAIQDVVEEFNKIPNEVKYEA